jgi:hypothetical protein
VDRQRRPAARVPVELGENHAGQPAIDAFLEPARDPHRVLPGHPVRHEQHLARARRSPQRLELFHQLDVDLQPTRGVHDDRPAARLLGLPHRMPDQLEEGPAPRSLLPRKDRYIDLSAELLQLLPCRGPRRVRRDQSRGLLLELETSRELGRGRRLARPLQSDQQDHGGANGREL